MPKPWLGRNLSNPIFHGSVGLDVATPTPFFGHVKFLDLSKLINDPMHHDPLCPPTPTKIPSDIPNFEENISEDLGDHMTTFHLWCLSNSFNENYVHLRLFQWTIIGFFVKWYIELPRDTYETFNQMFLIFSTTSNCQFVTIPT
jgi:hypothetical protein